MKLDVARLDNVRYTGGKTTARCPVCAEAGCDKAGDHLFIGPDGKFGCVNHQGPAGADHRKRIFALVGIKNSAISTPPPYSAPAKKQRIFTSAERAAKTCTPKDTRIEAVYLYPREGKEFGAVARYKTQNDKTFLQFHATPGGWAPGAPTGKWPLFRESELPPTGTIVICEGEKPAIAAVSIGLPATTSAGGSKAAAKSDWQKLTGREVVILPDNDPPGEGYAEEVCRILTSLKARVRIVRLPDLSEGGDIVDYLETRDAQSPENIRKEILDLAEKAPIWMPAQTKSDQTIVNIVPVTESEIFFNAANKSFLAPDNRGGWIPMSETQVKRLLRNQGVESAIPRGEHVSEIDRELLTIQTTQNVDYAGPLAGHRAGIVEIENRRILVTESPRIIEPAAGDWSILKTVVMGLLGEIQLPFLLGWIKIAYEALRVGKRIPGQALTIAGPRDCGKSLVQNLITPILGGRCARPYQFMTDGSPFNAHLFGAEHLMVEDEVPSMDLRARRSFGAQLKSITVNLEAQCHAKGQTPLMLRPFWRLTITLNDEPENLMVLPPIDESIFDKITLLKANEQSMPMPTGTVAEREAFWAQLISELPAFLAYLIDWPIPADMKSQRFGVTHYHHPDLVFALAELAPEHRLLSLIDGYLFGGMDQWTGTAESLERELTNAKSECRQEASKLFSFNTAAGTYLGRLAKRYPARFERERTSTARTWTIHARKVEE